MARTFFALILAIMFAMVSGQAVQAGYVAEGLELYLNAADTDGAGTAAPDATGSLWKDLSGETVHDGTLTLTNWDLVGVGSGMAQDPYAMRFDGVDDHVILDPVFSLDEFNVTLEFWVNVSSAIDEGERPARGYVYSEGSTSSRHKNSVYFTREDTVWAPQAVQYDHYTPSGSQVSKNFFYKPDEWMQVVVTKSGSDAVLYKNGVQDSTFFNVETYTGGNIKYTTVGAEINDYGERHFFIGDLGIVRLYNAALTTSEVRSNYNNDCETFGLTPVPEPEPLPKVAPFDLSTLSPSDFADDDLELPYYLVHLPQVVNSVHDSGPYRGWISLHVWRRTNPPTSPTIGDNVLSFLYLYSLDRPWNPYFGDPALRQRTEVALEYWCRMYDQAYDATSLRGHQCQMNSKYLGETMVLLHNNLAGGPPIDPAIYQYASDVHREVLRKLLSNTTLFRDRRKYTNQYSSVWADAAAHLYLHPEDEEIADLFRSRVQESMDLYQSPAGYFYELNGPDWRYNTITHQSNLRMAWHYCREAGLTDLTEMFEEKYARWFDWASYNLVREPDGSCFYLNRSIECRALMAVIDFLEVPAALSVENCRAFCIDEAELQEKLDYRRAEMESAWPEVDELVIGHGSAFAPYQFLHREQTQWSPTPQQRAEAVAQLPYLARDRFVHQRMDDRVTTVFTFIRRPAYYAVFNSGSKAASQQRLGLGLLWNDLAGTVLQSQTDSSKAVWGTKASGASQVYEANRLGASFYVDGQLIPSSVGNRDLDKGELRVSYHLGSSGEKSIVFGDDYIDVSITHTGTFTEQLPLVVGDGDEVIIDGSRATLVRPGASLVVEADESVQFWLTTTEFTANPDLQDLDTGALFVKGYSLFYRYSSVRDGRGRKDILRLSLVSKDFLQYRMTWVVPEPASVLHLAAFGAALGVIITLGALYRRVTVHCAKKLGKGGCL